MQRTIYAGWFMEANRDGHANLDQAMKEAGFKTVTIRHSGGTVVTHWAVETATMFVLADGIQSTAEMRGTRERYGIAYGWRTQPDGRRQSVLKARVFLRELLLIGYEEPVQLTLKSTVTGDMLDALTMQYAVLDAIERERAAKQQPPLNPPFYACSLPIGPGDMVSRGNTQKKDVIPMVAKVPDPITRSYLVQHYIRKEWIKIIEHFMDETVAWSVTTSAEIATIAESAPAEEEAVYDEESPATPAYRSYGRH